MALIGDIANGSNALGYQGKIIYPFNIAGSGVFAVLNGARGSTIEDVRKIENPQIADLHSTITDWVEGSDRGGVLFVIVESLGSPIDGVASDFLRQELSRGLPGHDLLELNVPFYGSTTDGELSLLCGVVGNYRNVSAKITKHCLPGILAEKGWRTVGMHGFHEETFNRREWWVHIGIGTSHFMKGQQLGVGRRCGHIYIGICDADVFMAAAELLRSGERREFVYLLTLDTHLPVLNRYDEISDSLRRAGETDATAVHLSNIGKTFRALGSQMSGLQPAPLIIIAGDHAPPFQNAADKSRFSKEIVPVYILVPKKQ